MSQAKGNILINSILMSIPIYCLVVYPIPYIILDGISSVARKFLWFKEGNQSGIPLVCWNRVKFGKIKEGLPIVTLNI